MLKTREDDTMTGALGDYFDEVVGWDIWKSVTGTKRGGLT